MTTAVYRLVESTTWRIGTVTPTPIHITLACYHVVKTDSAQVLDVIRQHGGRTVLHENALRVEMRCGNCEQAVPGFES